MGTCGGFVTGALLVSCVVLMTCGMVSASSEKSDNETTKDGQCVDGLVVPMWYPIHNLDSGDRFCRALVYFLAMVYLFIGVSIIADRFMASIEVITSKEREVKVKMPKGETQIIVVRVWNETVANLTLMALGSSAPEILLSVIEVYARNFEAGDLGPGTIVGSAAFNLFVIIAICVYVIPSSETRKIKHLRVFFVTAAWSVFAYVWLYIIVAVFSYGEVEVWEAIFTFLFFPITVLTAWIADRRLLIYKYLSKQYRLNRRGIVVEHEGTVEDGKSNHVGEEFKTFEEEMMSEEAREFEEQRREFILILKNLRKKHPDADMNSIEQMARDEVLDKGPKSRAYYRIQATKKLTGGGNLKRGREVVAELAEVKEEVKKPVDTHIQKIFFDPAHYTVMENVGSFDVTISREGGDLDTTVLVDYKTEDGTANAGSDYEYAEGTITFRAGEIQQSFSLSVMDDDVFEEDEHFYVRLSNLRVFGDEGNEVNMDASGKVGYGPKVHLQLGATPVATVMILDDDHGGIFNIAERDIEIVESVGTYAVRVTRWSGARGTVAVPYQTIEGTAKDGKDFIAAEGEIIFENNETEAFIDVQICEEDSYEKDVLFYMEIGEPRQISVHSVEEEEQEKDKKEAPTTNGAENTQDALTIEELESKDDRTAEEEIALLGRPRLGEVTRAQIRIKESKEFKNTVDMLVQRANASILVGTSSWRDQFIDAITVTTGDDDEEGDEEKMPTCGDYIMHFLTLFWKILFAFVPPTDYGTGWPCFVVAIVWIGCLTALIGDVSKHLGCTIGLKDSVTAIAFVALGTSVPDTFASKTAAVQDRYADASVGNVTGSNAVNVFLGIGVAWSLAAFYHAAKGDKFLVEPGNLGFSVLVFCVEAILAIGILLLRRNKTIGGELGGPYSAKLATTVFFVFLWLLYVVLSSLEAYKIIEVKF